MPYTTNVYVDAFNVYYGCTKDTPYRWLNLAELARVMLTNNTIKRIKVFTGFVKPRPHDPQQPIRQQIYFRALRTIPNLEIIEGTFLSHPRRFPVVQRDSAGQANIAIGPNGKPQYTEVMYTEEKGSDVNLASHLLYDGFINDYDMAIVISNDSDLAEPIRMTVQLLKKKVGILNPQINHARDASGKVDYEKVKPSSRLRRYATFCKPLTDIALQQSQFSPTLTDSKGTFHKPSSW